MDKSDLEDGEVTSSDCDEPAATPAVAVVADAAKTPVIDITSDKPPVKSGQSTSAAVIEIHSDDATAAVAGQQRSSAERKMSRSAAKRRNRALKQAEYDTHLASKKAKVDSQLAALEAEAEMDEYELLCVRGASPPRHYSAGGGGPAPPGATRRRRDYSDDELYSDDSDYDKHERRERRRKRQLAATGGRRRGGRGNNHADAMDDVTAAAYLRQPRKMELCKFFLTGQCAKTANCNYMHEDFPCKHYYLGIPHKDKDCIFTHGAPLEPAWQGALMKHVERAPESILGKFPRAYKTNAAKMMRATHQRLMAAAPGPMCTMFGGKVMENPLSAQAQGEKSQQQQQQGLLNTPADENGNGHRHNRDGGGGHNGSSASSSNPFAKQHNKSSAHNRPMEENWDAPVDESGRWSPSGKLRHNAPDAVQKPAAGGHKARAYAAEAAASAADADTESGRWSPSGRLRFVADVTTLPAATTPPQFAQNGQYGAAAGAAAKPALLPLPNAPALPAYTPPQQPSPPSQPLAPMRSSPITAQQLPPALPAAAAGPLGGRCADLMADILNADQLQRLRSLGVEYIAQVDNLTVAQLNNIGLSIAQIHQIQLVALQAAAAAQLERLKAEHPPPASAAQVQVVSGFGASLAAAQQVVQSSAVLPSPIAASVGVLMPAATGDVDMRIPPAVAMAMATTATTTAAVVGALPKSFQSPYDLMQLAPATPAAMFNDNDDSNSRHSNLSAGSTTAPLPKTPDAAAGGDDKPEQESDNDDVVDDDNADDDDDDDDEDDDEDGGGQLIINDNDHDEDAATTGDEQTNV